MDKNYYFNNLLQKNRNFLLKQESDNIDSKTIKTIVKTINEEKISILSGIRFTKKTKYIAEVIRKTKIEDKVFYFNTELDSHNRIKNNKDLEELLSFAKTNGKDIKIIILQHIGNIEEIKDFISFIYSENYKIVILGNDVKIKNTPTLYFHPNSKNTFETKLYYGNLGEYENKFISDIEEEILLKRDKLILEDIIKLKTVNNINLYYFIITFLSGVGSFESIRELHRKFTREENVALKTFMDYLEYSEQSELIEKIYLYDCKKEKINSANIKYFFQDNGLRNSFINFNGDENILFENYIFSVLRKCNVNKIFGGKNGSFDFSFYIEKDGITSAIQIFLGTDKNELKKDIHKLQKVPADKKIILIKNFDDLTIRKKEYDDVEIMTIENFQI